MEKPSKSEFLYQTFSAAITIAVALIGIFFLLKATGNTNKVVILLPIGTTTPATVQPSEYPDYDALKSLKVVVVASSTSSSEAGKNIVEDGITKRLLITGKFARLYLFVETSVDQKPLTDWDSFYMKIADQGGHLYRPDSLKVPSDDRVTRLLFNTSVVPYLSSLPYSASRTPVVTNWFDNIFNSFSSSPRKSRVDTFISTTRNGMIHLIAFYYACDETTPDCSIQVQ